MDLTIGGLRTTLLTFFKKSITLGLYCIKNGLVKLNAQQSEYNVFSEIFKVFSRRKSTSSDQQSKPLSKEFRNRVFMLFRDQAQMSFPYLFEELHSQVSYLHGKPRLSPALNTSNKADDLIKFLFSCNDEHFLDVIELIFRVDSQKQNWPDNPMISAINEFFKADNLPYHLTGHSIETSEDLFFDIPQTIHKVVEFPRVVRKENEVLYQEALEPALHLLSEAAFKHANTEFLHALEDHRRGDFRDCLTKCGSAFESAMKVICEKRSFPFKETDTASTLLRVLLKEGEMEVYWEQPLLLIATLRNRLSSSHGAGSKSKDVPKHVATYTINATASAIVFLVNEFS